MGLTGGFASRLSAAAQDYSIPAVEHRGGPPAASAMHGRVSNASARLPSAGAWPA